MSETAAFPVAPCFSIPGSNVGAFCCFVQLFALNLHNCTLSIWYLLILLATRLFSLVTAHICGILNSQLTTSSMEHEPSLLLLLLQHQLVLVNSFSRPLATNLPHQVCETPSREASSDFEPAVAAGFVQSSSVCVSVCLSVYLSVH